MQVSIHAPEWDEDFDMPVVPRLGEILVVKGSRWTITDVTWSITDSFDYESQSVHLTVELETPDTKAE